jgi:hypothetical protein
MPLPLHPIKRIAIWFVNDTELEQLTLGELTRALHAAADKLHSLQIDGSMSASMFDEHGSRFGIVDVCK